MKFLYLYVFMAYCSFVWGQEDYHSQRTISEKKLSTSEHFAESLHEELVDYIFPHWYGTPWDFNGYTDIPNKGVIACGYFVSTTIKHIGFNLNRYDIAKMYSSDIVKVLCFDDYWVESSFQNFLEKMNEMEDGLYIVGLSNHVGFIEQIDGRTYFIHSNYLGSNGVEKELANESEALKGSSTFWLGNFSNNIKVYDAFINNIEFMRID